MVPGPGPVFGLWSKTVTALGFTSPSGLLRDALNHVEKEFLRGYQDIQDHGEEEGGQVFGHGFLTTRSMVYKRHPIRDVVTFFRILRDKY